MMMAIVKVVLKILTAIGINISKMKERISWWSIEKAYGENGLGGLVEKLRSIVPDISNQEESEKKEFNDYLELKRRSLQAFQCSLILRAIESQHPGSFTIVDIGDSAGTHMIYVKALTGERSSINTISVNLDPRAIEKIKAKGLDAVLCRAEDLELRDVKVDLFTSFQMVEHLHNPAIFFHRLAKRTDCRKMVVTVPYLMQSRVGLHHIRNKLAEKVYAEDEHIFELSPKDWGLLFLHAGWKVSDNRVYYQYPKRWPIIRNILGWYWRHIDYEGFWGVILEKDTTFSDLYQDWEI
jgi:hypothetical protein